MAKDWGGVYPEVHDVAVTPQCGGIHVVASASCTLIKSGTAGKKMGGEEKNWGDEEKFREFFTAVFLILLKPHQKRRAERAEEKNDPLFSRKNARSARRKKSGSAANILGP